MPLKVAWGGGLTNHSSHDTNMVLIEQRSIPLLMLLVLLMLLMLLVLLMLLMLLILFV